MCIQISLLSFTLHSHNSQAPLSRRECFPGYIKPWKALVSTRRGPNMSFDASIDLSPSHHQSISNTSIIDIMCHVAPRESRASRNSNSSNSSSSDAISLEKLWRPNQYTSHLITSFLQGGQERKSNKQLTCLLPNGTSKNLKTSRTAIDCLQPPSTSRVPFHRGSEIAFGGHSHNRSDIKKLAATHRKPETGIHYQVLCCTVDLKKPLSPGTLMLDKIFRIHLSTSHIKQIKYPEVRIVFSSQYT